MNKLLVVVLDNVLILNYLFKKLNITIFNYIAYSNDENIKNLDKQIVETKYIEDTKKYIQDIDLRKLQLATDKYNKISILELLLKLKNAIDCSLNKQVNNIIIEPSFSDISSNDVVEFKDSYNETRLISYNFNNETKCIGEVENIEKNSNKEIDIYKNEQFKTFLNPHLITNTKFFIKTIHTNTHFT